MAQDLEHVLDSELKAMGWHLNRLEIKSLFHALREVLPDPSKMIQFVRSFFTHPSTTPILQCRICQIELDTGTLDLCRDCLKELAQHIAWVHESN